MSDTAEVPENPEQQQQHEDQVSQDVPAQSAETLDEGNPLSQEPDHATDIAGSDDSPNGNHRNQAEASMASKPFAEEEDALVQTVVNDEDNEKRDVNQEHVVMKAADAEDTTNNASDAQGGKPEEATATSAEAAPEAAVPESVYSTSIDRPAAGAKAKRPFPPPVSRPTSQQPQPKGNTTAASDRQLVAQRRRSSTRQSISSSRRPSGHQVILHAMAQDGEIGQHLNGHHMTTAEEYDLFRQRNRVAEGFRGPVFVAEDIHQPCAYCGGPVDPIARVPVGHLFFHMTCLQCHVCGHSDLTEPYTAVEGVAVCSNCSEKGFVKSVKAERIKEARGVVRRKPQQSRAPLAYTTTLNQVTLPGATAPSMTINPMHNRRNTSRRSFALMHRQQYYTQSDCNMMMARRPGDTSEQKLLALPSRRESTASGALPRLM